jgi:hypothetical protein
MPGPRHPLGVIKHKCPPFIPRYKLDIISLYILDLKVEISDKVNNKQSDVVFI